jgi:hypothetical protein
VIVKKGECSSNAPLEEQKQIECFKGCVKAGSNVFVGLHVFQARYLQRVLAYLFCVHSVTLDSQAHAETTIEQNQWQAPQVSSNTHSTMSNIGIGYFYKNGVKQWRARKES